MRVLITGGFGFIGGRLGQNLHQAGHQIVLGSRNAIGPPDWLPQAEVVRTDWNNECALEQICTKADVVIQAAGMNAQDCAADPVSAFELNGIATARLVEAAIRAGVKRFIYLSTAHVYSSPLVGAITEETCPRNPHPYATSHLAGENALLGMSRIGQIEGIVLRLSNAFGTPAHKNVNCWMLLVNDLCRQSAQTGKMVLRSNGMQQRDFIPMMEVCRVVGHLLSRDIDAASSCVINVGAGVSQSVLQMALTIQRRCRSVLGFEPELERPETERDQRQQQILEYRSDRLTKIGLTVRSDNASEIDGLLLSCHAWFNENRSESV